MVDLTFKKIKLSSGRDPVAYWSFFGEKGICQSHFHPQSDSMRPLVAFEGEILQILVYQSEKCKWREVCNSLMSYSTSWFLGSSRFYSKSSRPISTKLCFLLLGFENADFDHLKTWIFLPNFLRASVPEPLGIWLKEYGSSQPPQPKCFFSKITSSWLFDCSKFILRFKSFCWKILERG